MTFTIRTASPDDAEPLTAFAAAIFRDTFGAQNTAEDMDAYAAATFTTQRQRETLADPDSLVLLAEDDGGIAGYALLRAGDAPPEVRDPDPLELERFYVAAHWQGRGLAATLMSATLAAAEARGARTVWLGVWERNARAIAFYRRAGFEQVGAHVFMLGSDAQTDLLMAKALVPAG